MVNVRIRTVGGLRDVSIDRLRALVAAGKVPPDSRIVTTDGGLTWVSARELLASAERPPAPARHATPPVPASMGTPGLEASTEGIPGLVVTSFVLSGLSLFAACVTGIPAIICAALAMRQPRRRLAGVALAVSIGVTVVTTIVWPMVASKPSDGREPREIGSSATSDASAPHGAGRLPSAEPESQRQFVRIISKAADDYRSARNEIGEAASRDARRQAIQSMFRSAAVEGWIGRIQQISTNMDGLGILSVSIGQNVTITTHNNALSDMTSGTLIEKTSPVYESLKVLAIGDKVVISGSFVPSDEDHFSEQSITTQGSMLDPAFTFDFRSLQRVP